MLMNYTNASVGTKDILVAALIVLFAVSLRANAQEENDPNRPACSTPACHKIKSYVKAHYCGHSPAGNGPDDSCDIDLPKKPRRGVEVLADYRCEWNEAKQDAVCKQTGQPSASVRTILFNQLRRLGLPSNANGDTRFQILKWAASGLIVASAQYSRIVGDDIELCDVIATIDQASHVTVLRELRFQKTDVDVPKVTEWTLIDLADADGDGQADVILEGDAYEDHWLEVVSFHNGSPQTVYSGLGYYL